MSVKLVVAVTDWDWFDYLRQQQSIDEVNFWSPSARPFKALSEGELFLFKLHAPINKIVGGGIFAFANLMPLSLAWEAFGAANGAADFAEMRKRVLRYRKGADASLASVEIGCRVLTQPFFLPEERWFSPPSWSPNIVSLRTYSTGDDEGRLLWERVLKLRDQPNYGSGMSEPANVRFGDPMLIRPRLGQGAFRLLVTDLYERRCAITRERTLPALEAAHIRPYAEGGEHDGRNGILLRRDIHSLFDLGYVTITPDRRVEVSKRIREEFENGREYYALHGNSISTPIGRQLQPDPTALSWHNEHKYLG